MSDYKIAVIGFNNSGKTSFINRFTTNKFDFIYTPDDKIKKIEYLSKNFNIKFYEMPLKKSNINLDIIKELNRFIENNVDGIIFMVNLQNIEATEHCRELLDYFSKSIDNGIPCVIVGSKSDKKVGDKLIFVIFNIISSIYTSCYGFFESSAVTGYNIENPIMFLCFKIGGKIHKLKTVPIVENKKNKCSLQ